MPPIHPEKGLPAGIPEKTREELAEKLARKREEDNAWMALPFKPKELRTLKEAR